MNALSDLKQLNVQQLESKLLDLRKEQFNLRLKKANNALDKTHLINIIRRDIARIKMYIAEKGRTDYVGK